MATKDYNIGKFTESVIFLCPIEVITESGARETQYVISASRDAEVTDYSREHRQEQSALTEGESYIVRTWSVANANTSYKIRWNDVLYDVAKVVRLTATISEYYIERLDLCEN